MIISTTRFGELEIPEDKIITMAKPVLGFERLKQYCIIEREDCEPFLWYQSIDSPETAFIVCNPVIFYPDYRIEVNPRELEEIRITDVKAVETYSIVTVPRDPRQLSINLKGPIIINTENRLAKQLVLVNSDYKVKEYLIDIETVESEATGEKVEEPALTV
jgi:flagellar assembly factor FliW